MLSNGTHLTVATAKRLNKPYTCFNPTDPDVVHQLVAFCEKYQPNILNVAGNRESKSPGIATRVAKIIETAFTQVIQHTIHCKHVNEHGMRCESIVYANGYCWKHQP